MTDVSVSPFYPLLSLQRKTRDTPRLDRPLLELRTLGRPDLSTS